MKLYELTIFDKELSYDEYRQDFGIGIFSARETAEKTAEKYLTGIQGFKDCDCGYEITERPLEDISDEENIPDIVYEAQGWDENSRLDEINIITGGLFADKKNAEARLAELREEYSRKEWTLCEISINKCYWQDGFVRV